MRTLLVAVSAMLALSAVAAAAPSQSGSVSAKRLTTGFKQATGDKLVVDKQSSYPGHYVAYNVGPQSIARRAKYGTFTIYLVTGADVATEVHDLLVNPHTGDLGTAGPGNIYWESDTTPYGDKYWLAKKQYGANVVLWWSTTSKVRKTDRTFKLLHTTLTRVAS
jgi:hypothetical protein